MVAQNYRNLRAWQISMDLIELVYSVSANWPQQEQYGLTSQFRRAAVSIASNIAEGQGRYSRREFLRHLSIAHGSLREVETQIMIAARLGFSSESARDVILEKASESGKLINGLSKSLGQILEKSQN